MSTEVSGGGGLLLAMLLLPLVGSVLVAPMRSAPRSIAAQIDSGPMLSPA